MTGKTVSFSFISKVNIRHEYPHWTEDYDPYIVVEFPDLTVSNILSMMHTLYRALPPEMRENIMDFLEPRRGNRKPKDL